LTRQDKKSKIGDMKEAEKNAIQERIENVLPTLNEYQRRRFLSAEAKAIGRSGISLVSRKSGMSRQPLTNGVKELNDPETEIPQPGRSRKAGGGRKAITETQPGILEALEDW
jgi:DNA-binding phage protein